MKKYNYYILAEDLSMLDDRTIRKIESRGDVKIYGRSDIKARSEVLIGFKTQNVVMFVFTQEELGQERSELFLWPNFPFILSEKFNYGTFIYSTGDKDKFAAMIETELLSEMGGMMHEYINKRYDNIEYFQVNNPELYSEYDGKIIAHHVHENARELTMSLLTENGKRDKTDIFRINGATVFNSDVLKYEELPGTPLLDAFLDFHLLTGIVADALSLNGLSIDGSYDSNDAQIMMLNALKESTALESLLLLNKTIAVTQKEVVLEDNSGKEFVFAYDSYKTEGSSLIYKYRVNRQILNIRVSLARGWSHTGLIKPMYSATYYIGATQEALKNRSIIPTKFNSMEKALEFILNEGRIN